MMESLPSYTGFSDIYDILTDDVEYEKRCKYIEELFKKHMSFKPDIVADLGCGTGTVCSIMSRKGYDMIGIDSSDSMLHKASQKKSSEKILYLLQDMCSFELYGTVDAFLCMLDSLNYITEPEDVAEVFSLVANYLNPGGVFIFDVNTMYKYENVLSDNTFVFEEKNVFYTWENSFDGEYCDYRLNFFVNDENGKYRRFCEEHSQRYHDHAFLVDVIENSGLVLEAVYGEMTESLPKEEDQRVFYVVKKK